MRWILLFLLISCTPKEFGENHYAIYYDKDIGFFPLDYIQLEPLDFYIYNIDTRTISMNADRSMDFVFVHYVVVNDSAISFMIGNGFSGMDFIAYRDGDQYIGKAYEYWGYPQPFDSTKIVIEKMD